MTELEYLVASRHGVEPELAVLDELAGGAWVRAGFAAEDLDAARSVVDRYRDQPIASPKPIWWCWPSGLARDAS